MTDKIWRAFWTPDRYQPSNGTNVAHPGATPNAEPTTPRGKRRAKKRDERKGK